MKDKIYKCDRELETLILKQGWIETTDSIDKIKGKKEFRKNKSSRIYIRFDYINLIIYENGIGINGIEGPQIALEDLKLFFWYFNSSSVDKKYISNGHFDLDRIRQCIKTMTNLLGYHQEFNHHTQKTKKIERLLNNLQEVELN